MSKWLHGITTLRRHISQKLPEGTMSHSNRSLLLENWTCPSSHFVMNTGFDSIPMWSSFFCFDVDPALVWYELFLFSSIHYSRNTLWMGRQGQIRVTSSFTGNFSGLWKETEEPGGKPNGCWLIFLKYFNLFCCFGFPLANFIDCFFRLRRDHQVSNQSDFWAHSVPTSLSSHSVIHLTGLSGLQHSRLVDEGHVTVGFSV